MHEKETPWATDPSLGSLHYRLFTSVPDYWNPMLLADRAGQRHFFLNELDDVRGALLAPFKRNPRLTLFEEEVPRSGVRLSRAYLYTRWVHGSRHAWVGRRKQTGRGEGSSSLRFDAIDTKINQ